MKKTFVLLLAAALLLSGCSNKSQPTGLDSYVEVKNGTSADVSGQEQETQELTLDEIPKEYKNIEGNIFAVVKDGEIVGYKYGKKDGDKWTFVDCDEKGNIVIKKATTKEEKTKSSKTTTTTTTTTSKSTSTTTSALTTTKSQITSSTPQPTQRRTTTSPVSSKQNVPQTTKPVTQSTTKATSKSTTQSTTKATTTVPFSYTFINGLSGLPSTVKNYFQYYIDRADINSLVTKEKIGDNGNLYVMLYMLNGSPVTIRGVQSNGVITYHLGSGTTTVCRIIEIKGFNGKVSYNKV